MLLIKVCSSLFAIDEDCMIKISTYTSGVLVVLFTLVALGGKCHFLKVWQNDQLRFHHYHIIKALLWFPILQIVYTSYAYLLLITLFITFYPGNM